MSTPVKPEIVVEITLLTTEVGGRKNSIPEGEYRGVLGVGTENFSVRFFIPIECNLTPGATQQIGVQFLFPEIALPHFPVGATFTVWEGRIIGNGRVLEVLKQA
ncbi:hypothetical protein SAMN02745119_00872 [Trichlorobacter thiogenes]|uniref:Elongation factor Tu n=1 Tax=Trichlorobacter thiogenes TaxID=115783 RepID=A0A1T4LC84_9BACT|nr:hypothetical protein [Trichlorobacter thiogenes]SJZ52147.1 hypothetical protein SAMN02745119_00872 [Trichlorobacter thiogenes]